MSLLPVVERHLRAHSVPPSRFGRLVTGDPRFVFDVRLDGVGAAAALAALSERLAHETITIAGQILAEALVEPGTADDEGVAMTICALVIND
jgi:hypothetical protein